ncbi:MAG: carbon storage regulator [Planctomycetota bacterium]|nr:MAG: carbon storage regulator [Planctomycetota bacterium]
MLVLSRKEQETLHIGSDITITITRIRGNRVQIGISAPHDVPVVRGELLASNLVDAPLDAACPDATPQANSLLACPAH